MITNLLISAILGGVIGVAIVLSDLYIEINRLRNEVQRLSLKLSQLIEALNQQWQDGDRR